MMVCVRIASNRLPIHSTGANYSSLHLAVLASDALGRHLTLLGILLIVLRCHHHLLYLLVLFALALSLAAFAFVVVLLVWLLAVAGVEVGLSLVRSRGEGRRVGVLVLIAGACVAILRL